LAEPDDLFAGAAAGAGEVCEDEAEEGAVVAGALDAAADAGFAVEAIGADGASGPGTDEVKESVGTACCAVVEDEGAEGLASRKVVADPAVDRSTGGALVICMISPSGAMEAAPLSIGRYGRCVHSYYRMLSEGTAQRSQVVGAGGMSDRR
jgi:hypothetical protein